MANYDYSDLGGSKQSKYDYSDLGGIYSDQANKPDDNKAIGGTGYKSFSHLAPELKNLAGGILDMFSRTGTAMGEAGEYLGNNPLSRAINRALPESVKFVTPEMRDVNIRNLTGADQGGQDILGDPNSQTYQIGQMLGGIGQASMIGGTSLPGMALGGGAATALTANPDQKLLSSHLPIIGSSMPEGRLPAAIEASLFGMLAPEAGKILAKTPAAISNTTGRALDLLQPNKLTQNIMNELGGGKTLEEHAQQFANDIKQSHDIQKARISKDYNDFFDQNNLASKELYPEIDKMEKGGRFKVNEPRYYRETPEFPSGLGSEEYENALNEFNNNPNVRNGHLLQSQLAAEERRLQREYDVARAKGEPVTDIAQQLKLTKNSRQKLLGKLYETMGDQADRYKQITSDFLKNQVPYYSNKSLRDIVSGKETNPSRSQFGNIFKNPDENINTIMNHLGSKANNDVLFQSLGLQPEDATAKDLIRGIKRVKAGGFETYPSTDLKSSIQDVKRANITKKIALSAAIAGGLGQGSGLAYLIYKSLMRE